MIQRGLTNLLDTLFSFFTLNLPPNFYTLVASSTRIYQALMVGTIV
jgi:hypothetical protein